MDRLVQVLRIIAINSAVVSSANETGQFCFTAAGREWCETGCCGTTQHSGHAASTILQCCMPETRLDLIVRLVVLALSLIGPIAFFSWCCWYMKVARHKRIMSMPHSHLNPGSTANPLTNDRSSMFGDSYKNASGRSIPPAPAAPYRPPTSSKATRPTYSPFTHRNFQMSEALSSDF